MRQGLLRMLSVTRPDTDRPRSVLSVMLSAMMLCWSVAQGSLDLSGRSSILVEASVAIVVWDGAVSSPIGHQRGGSPEYTGGLVSSGHHHAVQAPVRAIARPAWPVAALLEQGKGLITLQTSADI